MVLIVQSQVAGAPAASRLMKVLLLLLFGAIPVCASAQPIGTPLEMRMEVTANPLSARPVERCEQAADVVMGTKQKWWASFGEAQSGPDHGRAMTRAPLRCGPGSLVDAAASAHGAGASAAFAFEISVYFGRIEDGVQKMEVTVASRRVSGFAGTAEPSYEESTVKRLLTAEQTEDYFMPLAIVGAAERSQLDAGELFLHLRIVPRHDSGASFGTVMVRSDSPGAEVLVDGGVVGRVPDSGVQTLRNLPVGEQELKVRDAAGREARTLVRVRSDRTVVAALLVMGEPSPPKALLMVSAGKNAQGYEEFRRERDGALMVKIPEGEFTMGNLETERQPLPHKVTVGTFLMDKVGVSFGQFKKFLEATGGGLPPNEPYWGIHDDHPAAFVTWEEGRAYCEWAGGRLPSEAEREKAARGTTDLRKWPWGKEDPDPERAVFRHNWGSEATGAVGIRPKGMSPYGLFDMGGNMWEWCQDWYEEDYYQKSPAKDPMGPETGVNHVVRGGSWDSRPDVLSASCRNWGYVGYREGDFGFRCAMDAPK